MANLFNFHKIDYIKGKKRPDVECILCGVRDKLPEIERLEIIRTDLTIICVNLYPYNPGHLMIFPQRHVKDIRELTAEETRDIDKLTNICLDIMDDLYSPCGYNIGYNIGESSGASISHIHRHIVPRYPNEIGFIDIIGGAKIIIEEPTTTMERFQEAFNKYRDRLD
jgi:ATP adenylyltransferase